MVLLHNQGRNIHHRPAPCLVQVSQAATVTAVEASTRAAEAAAIAAAFPTLPSGRPAAAGAAAGTSGIAMQVEAAFSDEDAVSPTAGGSAFEPFHRT